MRRSAWIVARLYALLLRLYPRAYWIEYGQELRAVFGLTVHEAAQRGTFPVIGLSLRELRDLPGAILHEHRRGGKMAADGGPDFVFETGSWREALAGTLPLVGFVVSIVMAGVMRRLLAAAHLGFLYRLLWADAIRAAAMPMAFYLLLGGLLAAWLKGFPRWSYPYLGWLPVFVLSGFLGPDDPTFWRIWAPLLGTLLFALLLRPSLAPLKALWHSWRQDWTLSSFAVLSLLAFLVAASFDEMPGPRVLWQLLSTAAFVVGAVGYVRTPKRAGRVAALQGSAVLGVAISIVVTSYTWHGVRLPGRDSSFDGYAMLSQSVVIWSAYLVVLHAPAIASVVLKRLSRRKRSAL
jgi:hypothetical protein